MQSIRVSNRVPHSTTPTIGDAGVSEQGCADIACFQADGRILRRPILGGLHHHYVRI
jgi:hypothetical protein